VPGALGEADFQKRYQTLGLHVTNLMITIWQDCFSSSLREASAAMT
jgi:hypothetical protein